MQLKLNTYLKDLRRNADLYTRTDINGAVNNGFKEKYLSKTIFCVLSLATILIIGKAFPTDFISYASTMLSIFIGLFITALIFSFDKFYKIELENQDKIKAEQKDVRNSNTKLWDTQAFNYSKQFAYITGYNIVLCVFTLIVLSFSFLFHDFLSINLFDYTLAETIDINSILLFFKLVVVIIQRFLILFWILNIMYNTLFIVSSMVKFMMVKLDRVK